MKSLQKFLVVFVVIATGLGAAMLFRKQDAEGEAGNDSGAQAAGSEDAPADNVLPPQKLRQTVPLPTDVAAAASGATNTNPPASGNSSLPTTTPASEAIPTAQPNMRTPPVLPPAFPAFRPREMVPDAADPADPAEQRSPPVGESIAAPAPPRIVPNGPDVRFDATAPPPVARNVTPPAPSTPAVAPPPWPVEAASPVTSQPPPQLRTHRIVNGDTLARIARRYLGSEERGAEVFELNRGVLTDPQMLPLGRTIKIPPRDGLGGANAAPASGAVLPLPPLVPLPPGALARP